MFTTSWNHHCAILKKRKLQDVGIFISRLTEKRTKTKPSRIWQIKTDGFRTLYHYRHMLISSHLHTSYIHRKSPHPQIAQKKNCITHNRPFISLETKNEQKLTCNSATEIVTHLAWSPSFLPTRPSISPANQQTHTTTTEFETQTRWTQLTSPGPTPSVFSGTRRNGLNARAKTPISKLYCRTEGGDGSVRWR